MLEKTHKELMVGLSFETLEQVEAFVVERGEDELDEVIASGYLSALPSGKIIAAWRKRKERQLADAHAERELGVALRAAIAAEKSARWSAWSATLSLISTIVAAATVAYTFWR